MATYAVGDIQGCLASLQKLLDIAHFDPSQDTLWIAGDLVNRGPDSLGALRFAKQLPSVKMVLGNHDLHLLAAAKGFKKLSPKDTLQDILQARDSDELLNWLQDQPLVHHDSDLGYTMVHAGIPPMWTIRQALSYSQEVEQVLHSEQANDFFSQMYGNEPSCWDDSFQGNARLRLITNYFTRMRFCTAEGQLELKTKTEPNSAPEGYAPWFAHENHKCAGQRIIFGHWASLQGKSNRDGFYALDTGCVWGGDLTMMRLEDQTCFSVSCPCNDNL